LRHSFRGYEPAAAAAPACRQGQPFRDDDTAPPMLALFPREQNRLRSDSDKIGGMRPAAAKAIGYGTVIAEKRPRR